MRNKARRSLALILSVAMTVTLWKTPVYAVMESGQSDTGLCEHHTVHTEDCGYTEETPCPLYLRNLQLSERRREQTAAGHRRQRTEGMFLHNPL